MKNKQHFLTIEEIEELCKRISGSVYCISEILAKMKIDMKEEDISEENLDSIRERIFQCADCCFYFSVDKMSEYPDVCSDCVLDDGDEDDF